MKHKFRWLAVMTGVAMTVSACGGSNDDSGDGSNTPSIKIMSIVSSASAVDLTRISGGFDAGIEQLNKAGGIDGHKIELVKCNDLGEANQAQKCLREAVDDKSIVAIAGVTLAGSVYAQGAQQAGLPYISYLPISPDDQSRAALSTSAGTTGSFGGLAAWFTKEKGFKRIGLISPNISAEDQAGKVLKTIVKQNGAKLTEIRSAADQGDYLPIMQQMIAADVQAVVFATNSDSLGAVADAYKTSGAKFAIGFPQSTIAPHGLEAMTRAGLQFYVAGAHQDPDGDALANEQYRAAMKSAGETATNQAQAGYAGSQAVIELIRAVGIDNASRESVESFISKGDFKLPEVPMFSGPISKDLASVPEFASIGSFTTYIGSFEDGKYTLADPNAVDVAPYLKGGID